MIDFTVLGRRIVPGARVKLAEEDHLHFVIRTDSRVTPTVVLAAETLPLDTVGDGHWRADPDWVRSAASRHFVGECPVTLDCGEGSVSATIVRQPTRITEDDFAYLLAYLQRRGASSDDPLGRTRVWVDFAPSIPTNEEESGLVLLQLFDKVAESLRRVSDRPLEALQEDEVWMPISALRGSLVRRVDPRRVVPWDPPRPIPSPSEGLVCVRGHSDDAATPENRFVVAQARRLVGFMRFAADTIDVPASVRTRLLTAIAQITVMFSTLPWSELADGKRPHSSFVLRDNPAYRQVAWLGDVLDEYPRLMLQLSPTMAANRTPINPWSLNVLYERWVCCVAIEELEEYIGPLDRPPVPARGRFVSDRRPVAVQVDYRYSARPRPGQVFSTGKNCPDLSIELIAPGHAPRLLVIDATYSRNPNLHDEKLGYRTSLRVGGTGPLGVAAPLCVDWAAVAYPGDQATVIREERSGLAEAVLSVPANEAGAQLLRDWINYTIGPELNSG